LIPSLGRRIYRARFIGLGFLKTGEKSVVVKVQRPNINQSTYLDLALMEILQEWTNISTGEAPTDARHC
jgi:predicted unusual protein kinase regulating ubiquinone biosynthesis (AarF/ABC1/UbiB family)